MTRYTDFARKRTYVQAGLDHKEQDNDGQELMEAEQADSSSGKNVMETEQATGPSEPTKKRQKKDSSKRKSELKKPAATTDIAGDPETKDTTEGDHSSGGDEQANDGVSKTGADADCKRKRSRGAIRAERRRVRDAQARKQSSEQRRLKRKDKRSTDTVCFACREKGHAARDCTKSLKPLEENVGTDVKAGVRKSAVKTTVGVCYRCGSRKHNLSLCQEPVDPTNPLPFASCFVCAGKGHIASTCSQNQSKGVYPNGGCCKLCGETTHLAKDCGVRKKVDTTASAVLGTGAGAGADEDDFHALKRRTVDVDKSEKLEQRVKRQAKIMVGAHSGVVKSFARSRGAPARKAVQF